VSSPVSTRAHSPVFRGEDKPLGAAVNALGEAGAGRAAPVQPPEPEQLAPVTIEAAALAGMSGRCRGAHCKEKPYA